MNSRWIRKTASMALATLLGGATPLPLLALALDPDCEGGIKGEVMPVEVNGIKVDVNVNNSSSAAQEPPGVDNTAGQPGRTEYPGTPQHGCLSDGKTCW